MSIPLLAGNPDCTPASFSRFVLPFAYQLTPAYLPELKRAGQPSEVGSWDHVPRWVLWDDSDAQSALELGAQVTLDQRKRYFTSETAEVLFGSRTMRFRLQCPTQAIGPVTVQVDGVAAQLETPELLLFECAPFGKRGADPMRIGLLVLSVHFTGNALQLDQLLKFNEAFRNMRQPYVGHAGAPDLTQVTWLKQLNLRSESTRECADAPYLKLWLDLLEAPLVLTEKNAPYYLYSNCLAQIARGGSYLRSPLIHADYRAFTWTAAVCEGGALVLNKPSSDQANRDEPSVLERWLQGLKSKSETRAEKTGQKPAESHGWLRLLNVDGPGWQGAPPHSEPVPAGFHGDWLRDHTYFRWAPQCLYGFTPHSGAAFVSVQRDPPIWNHFRRLYFDQLCLMLYVRGTIFGFSRDISALSRKIQVDRGGASHFNRLERQFSLFTNLYQFPLLSNQQQSLEMYAALRKALDINDFYDEVQDEIRHMASMFDRRHDRDIRMIGVAIALIATIGTLWGDMDLGAWLVGTLGLNPLLAFFVMLLPLVLTVFGGLAWMKRRD